VKFSHKTRVVGCWQAVLREAWYFKTLLVAFYLEISFEKVCLEEKV